MNFTIHRDSFLSALSFVGSVIEKRSTIPILMNVKIEANADGRLTCHGTNLDVYLKTWRDARVINPGAFTVEHADLLSIVKGADDEIAVSVDGQSNRATITSGTSRFVLMGRPAEDYPTEPEVGTTAALANFPPSLILPAFTQASYCMSTEEPRFMLAGTLMKVQKTGVELVSTNGHAMAVVSLLGRYGAEAQLSVGRDAIAAMHKMPVADELAFALGDRLTVESGNCWMSVRLVDVNFPKYREFIATDLKVFATVDRERLLAVVRSVMMMTNEKTRAVKVEILKGQVKVSTVNPEKGEAAASAPADTDGTCWIGMNAAYLIAALTAIPTDKVRISAKDELSQIQLVPEPGCEDMDSIHVIMPMRLN